LSYDDELSRDIKESLAKEKRNEEFKKQSSLRSSGPGPAGPGA